MNGVSDTNDFVMLNLDNDSRENAQKSKEDYKKEFQFHMFAQN